jgi:hypothetical protein
MRSVVYRLLASENVRIEGGAEVDAMATLQRARATMQNEMSVANELGNAELSDQALRDSAQTAANTTP